MFAFSIFMLEDSNFKFGGGQSRINNILLKKEEAKNRKNNVFACERQKQADPEIVEKRREKRSRFVPHAAQLCLLPCCSPKPRRIPNPNPV